MFYYPDWDQRWCKECIDKLQLGLTQLMGQEFFFYPFPKEYTFFHHMMPTEYWKKESNVYGTLPKAGQPDDSA